MPVPETRVLLFGKIPPPYIGPAVATSLLLNSSLRERYGIIHLDTSDPRGIETLGKFDVQNVLVALRQYARTAKLLRRHRPGIVYILCAQTTIAYLRDIPFVLLARLFRARVVFHLRGGRFRAWYESLGPVMRWIVHVVHPRIHAQIVLGTNLRGMYEGIIPLERVHVVPNGGDYGFRPGQNNGSDTVTVLYLGNFIPTKGIMEFMESARLVHGAYRNVRFIAAGNWQDPETKEAMLSQQESMRECFTIMENVAGDAKKELLENADIFVFPTYYPYEGHPWVIVEAMAAGLPIITTDHAAIAESVVHGENGFLVEKQSAEAVAEAIEMLLKDESLRMKMGEMSRKRYEEGFTLDHMVNRLSAVFDHVLQHDS